SGPEGQIFGPMAETYAFSLAGALLLAITVAPTLCYLLLRHLKPARDNFLVRFMKSSYLKRLKWCLDNRYLTLGFMLALLLAPGVAMQWLGREFMPELEEGNVYVRGTFPVNVSLEEVATKSRIGQKVMASFAEVERVTTQVGRPDDGTDP